LLNETNIRTAYNALEVDETGRIKKQLLREKYKGE
jgi:hypothetical protein